jgi:hypothetical protein
MELIGDLTLVLVAALVGGFVAHRVGQPLIVGYIVAGVDGIDQGSEFIVRVPVALPPGDIARGDGAEAKSIVVTEAEAVPPRSRGERAERRAGC